jgi:hypothetical protein
MFMNIIHSEEKTMPEYKDMISGILPDKMPDAGSFDIIALIESKLLGLLPENILGLYNANRVIVLLGFAFLLLLLAVQGYKIFKSLLYVVGAVGFAYVGYTYLVPHLPESFVQVMPEGVSAAVVVAVVCALVAVFLTRCAFPFMIMILGAGTGYLLGSMVVYGKLIGYFHTLTFLQTPVVKYVIGGALAAVLGIVFLLMFKHLFMVATSFGGSLLAALALQKIIMPGADQTIVIAFAIVSVAFGIFCVVKQYKQEEKDTEIVF